MSGITVIFVQYYSGVNCITQHRNVFICIVDPLVFNLQFIYDGYLPCWPSQHDPNANIAQRLCSIQQRGRWR